MSEKNSDNLDPISECFKMLNELNLEQARLYRESKLRIVHPVVANSSGFCVRVCE